MGKKIGIIIPSYNQGKYLEQTILSVLENKQHVDMQIAVIDGGSTDESIKNYSKISGAVYILVLGTRQRAGRCD